MNIFSTALTLFGFKGLESQDHLVLQQNFIEHIQKYNLQFATQEEFDFRFQIFAEKDAFIKT
jgi:hypothetical protein